MRRRETHRTILGLPATLFCCYLACQSAQLLWCSAAQLDPFRFIIRADPPSIPANGRSTTTISIQIDSAQNPALVNGAIANFVTTLGVIDPVARISGNTARVTLRSGAVPGTAVVTALVGVSREQVEVEFVPTIGGATLETKSVSVRGRNIVFHPDLDLVVATGNSAVRFRRMKLKCDLKFQFDVKKECFLAEGQPGENHVVLNNGRQTLTGDRLRYDLKALRGVLLKINPQPSRMYFSGDTLEERDIDMNKSDANTRSTSNLDEIRFPEVDALSGTVVVARQVVVYPREKIKFKRARIYIDGRHVMSLPLHVLPLTNNAYAAYGIVGDRVFGYNTNGGFGLDFPFYYRVTSGGQGALHLRHAGGDGVFSQAPGWTFALQEDYSLNESGAGTLLVDKLSRGDWGLQWNHSQNFSPGTRGYLYLSSPQHQDLFGRATLTKEFSNYTLGLESFGNAASIGYNSWETQLYWQRRPQALSRTGIQFSPSAQVSYSYAQGGANSEVVSENLQVPLYLPTVTLSKRTTITSSLQPQAYHDSAGLTGAGVGAGVTLSQSFSNNTNLTLSYTRSVGGASSLGLLNTQYLSATFMSVPSIRLQLVGTGTYNMSDQSFFGSGTAAYQLNPTYQLGLTSTYQKFYGDSFVDHDVTLRRRIGKSKMEGIVGWSRSRGRLYFQIGNLSF